MNDHKVLLIDDDAEILRLFSRSLSKAGFDLVSCQDGVTALTVARKEQPNVIILDMGLPGGGGMEVLNRIQRNAALSGVPVLVLTGHPDMEREAREAGAAGFLAKPVTPPELIVELERLVGA